MDLAVPFWALHTNVHGYIFYSVNYQQKLKIMLDHRAHLCSHRSHQQIIIHSRAWKFTLSPGICKRVVENYDWYYFHGNVPMYWSNFRKLVPCHDLSVESVTARLYNRVLCLLLFYNDTEFSIVYHICFFLIKFILS